MILFKLEERTMFQKILKWPLGKQIETCMTGSASSHFQKYVSPRKDGSTPGSKCVYNRLKKRPLMLLLMILLCWHCKRFIVLTDPPQCLIERHVREYLKLTISRIRFIPFHLIVDYNRRDKLREMKNHTRITFV